MKYLRALILASLWLVPWNLANALTFGSPVESSVAAASTNIAIVVPAGGGELVVFVTWNNSTVTLTSVVDSVGSTALTQRGSTLSSSSTGGATFTLDGATAGTHTVTVTMSGTTSLYVGGLYVGAANGVDVAAVHDSNFAGTGANAITSTSMTTTTNGDAIVGFTWTASGTGVVSAGTSPNSFTSLSFATTNAFGEEFVQTTAGSIAATGTSSSNSDILVMAVAVKAVVSGAALAGAATDAITAAGALTTKAAPYAPIVLDNTSHTNGSDNVGMGSGPGTGTGDTAEVAFTKLKQWAIDANTMFAKSFPSTTLQAPTTGFSSAPAQGVTLLVLNPSGTLATGTVTLPQAPGDQQPFQLMSSQTITALTVQTADGTTLNGAPTTLSANTSVKWRFQASANTWFRE